MIAEILAVGTELLMGQIVNTNAQYISNRLPDVGVSVYYQSVVGDNPGRLKECLNIALGRSDTVILTGGLGPTKDDLTKETVSEVLNRKLVLNEECFQVMKDFFKKMNRPMTENNVKQAYLPEGSIIIKNSNGTAPGCIIEADGKVVIMLPGPPQEMRPMFEETVIPYFMKLSSYRLESKFIRIFGMGESAVADKIADLIDNQTNPTIAPYAKEGEVTLRVTAKYSRDETEPDIITPVVDAIKARLGDTVYSVENESLEEVAARLLLKNNITISIAESCTGGLVSARLTEIPGISKVFNRAIITYSNESKMENLGVKAETLEKHGAVSRETALEMAEGVRKVAGTDIGVSITGIAGPGGATPQKPVGLVFVALSDGEKTYCRELRLWGDRRRIRNVAAHNVFDMVRRYITKLSMND